MMISTDKIAGLNVARAGAKHPSNGRLGSTRERYDRRGFGTALFAFLGEVASQHCLSSSAVAEATLCNGSRRLAHPSSRDTTTYRYRAGEEKDKRIWV